MGQLTSRIRPWIAPLVSGPGHRYLGRVWRTVGWLAVPLGMGRILADPSTAGVSSGLPEVDPLAVAAVGTLGVFLILDAYYVAHAENVRTRTGEVAHDEHGSVPTAGGNSPSTWRSVTGVPPKSTPVDPPVSEDVNV